jgi:hypothetical protein
MLGNVAFGHVGGGTSSDVWRATVGVVRW